jgi:hypothetical protein
VARSLLVREMRARNSRERCGSGGDGGGGSSSGIESTSSPTNHPRQTNEENPNNPSSTTTPNGPSQQSYQQHDDELDIDDIDDDDGNAPSSRHLPLRTIFSQRIQQLFTKIISWYHSQSDDIRTLLLISIVFLVLYVALGGRFGFDSTSLLGESRHHRNGDGVGRTTRGNYGQGNAYERYSTQNSRHSSEAINEAYDNYYGRPEMHKQQQQQQHHQQEQTRASTGYNDRTNPQNDEYYSSRYEHYDYEPRRGGGRGRTSTTSYHMVRWSDSNKHRDRSFQYHFTHPLIHICTHPPNLIAKFVRWVDSVHGSSIAAWIRMSQIGYESVPGSVDAKFSTATRWEWRSRPW